MRTGPQEDEQRLLETLLYSFVLCCKKKKTGPQEDEQRPLETLNQQLKRCVFEFGQTVAHSVALRNLRIYIYICVCVYIYIQMCVCVCVYV